MFIVVYLSYHCPGSWVERGAWKRMLGEKGAGLDVESPASHWSAPVGGGSAWEEGPGFQMWHRDRAMEKRSDPSGPSGEEPEPYRTEKPSGYSLSRSCPSLVTTEHHLLRSDLHGHLINVKHSQISNSWTWEMFCLVTWKCGLHLNDPLFRVKALPYIRLHKSILKVGVAPYTVMQYNFTTEGHRVSKSTMVLRDSIPVLVFKGNNAKIFGSWGSVLIVEGYNQCL